MKVVDEFVVGHPVESVWPYLAVLEKRSEFIPQVVEMARADTGPLGVGAEWRSVNRVGLWKVSAVDMLTVYEPESRVAWDTSEPWNAHTQYRLVPVDSKSCVVHLDFEAHPSGWLKLMDWFPDSILKQAIRSDHQRLEDILDGES